MHHNAWVQYKGWAKHQNFGLRKEWLDLWLKRPEEWDSLGVLGNRQVESFRGWLKTGGLVDAKGRPTDLAIMFRQEGIDSLKAWEILWVNTVFSFPTARWYVSTFHRGKWTMGELQRKLQSSLPRLSPRTIYNSLLELVGLLERTPIGRELGQGEVEGQKARVITRRGLDYPSWPAIKRALQLLRKETGSRSIPANNSLLLPWVVFGSDKQCIIRIMAVSGEVEIDKANAIKLLS